MMRWIFLYWCLLIITGLLWFEVCPRLDRLIDLIETQNNMLFLEDEALEEYESV